MELACVVVLLVAGAATAGPYGHGTKGGAAAKADARAATGAYTGAEGLPLSIPSGASSYSGSFSKSSSSSSSSSTASSSSFSFSGSGAIGGVLPGGRRCGFGNCNTGGTTGTLGSAAIGTQAFTGANAGSFVGTLGHKIPTGSYGHKYGHGAQTIALSDCESGNCQGTSDLSSSDGNSAGVGSQSSSDANAAASSEAGQLTDSDCGGSSCDSNPNDKCVTGQCGSKAKCSSGSCGVAIVTEGSPSQYDLNKCTSDQCGPNKGTDVSTSVDNDTNDINVNTEHSGPKHSKTFHDANKPGCANGKCGITLASGPHDYNIPSLDLTVPKLESPCSSADCPISTPGYNSFSHTKTPSFSTILQNENQSRYVPSKNGGLLKPNYGYGTSPFSSVKPLGGAGCAPGTQGCANNVASSIPSDCSSGSCGTKPSVSEYVGLSSIKPSYSHDTIPLVNPSSAVCTFGTPGCKQSSSPYNPSYCAFGNCGLHNSAPSGSKPSYTYVSSTSSTVNPSDTTCGPGTPGCSSVSGPSGYGSFMGVNPNYSHVSSSSYSSINPSGLDCSPGSTGCTIPAAPSGPSGCASGNCDGTESLTSLGKSKKPSDSRGGSSLNSESNGCLPGNPGCAASPTRTDSSGCASGDCNAIPTHTKPNYSLESSPSYNFVKPVGPCIPGTHGCIVTSSTNSGCLSGNCETYPSAPGMGEPSSVKPNYAYGSSSFHSSVKPVDCTPGVPGCNAIPSTSGPSDCVSGNCGAYPVAPGYGRPSSTIPNYSYASTSSYSPMKPVEPCTPGNPGCSTTPSASRSSDCISGNCGSLSMKPNDSQGGFPLFSSLVASGPACAPGSPNCGTAANVPTDCPSGNCGAPLSSAGGGSLSIKPNYSDSLSAQAQANPAGQACGPGNPGCLLPLGPNSPLSCISGICDEFPPIGGQGVISNYPVKASYSQESSLNFPGKPIKPSCVPGAPGCAVIPSISSAGCASGSCGTYLSTQGCTPGIPGCSRSTSNIHLGASESVHASIPVPYNTPMPSGQTSAGGIAFSQSSVGPTSHQAAYGNHGSGSLQTSFNKPSTGISGSGVYMPPILSVPSASKSPGILVSLPQLATMAGSSGKHDEKEYSLPYTGGFGGPPGILKPNEYSVTPTTNIDNKASVTAATAIKPSNCVSGNCDTLAYPSGTALGAHSTVGASANANAVAYTGGFGGPPGLLKPYDDGKADNKGATGQGSSLDLYKVIVGSGHLSSGSGIAMAQAAGVKAAGFATNGGYSRGHGHDETGGCGSGCGGSDSGGPGYSRSLGVSNTGGLGDSSYGLASAGAAAKSAANASSGARAFGNSYASSSASATAGASVKGGYGR